MTFDRETVTCLFSNVSIAVITIILTNIFADKKARNKAKRERAASIENDIREFQKWGRDYWVQDHDLNARRLMETTIKGQKKRIATEMGRLNERGFKCQTGCAPHLKALNKAITDGKFESVDWLPELWRIERINSAAEDLIGQLRRLLGVI